MVNPTACGVLASVMSQLQQTKKTNHRLVKTSKKNSGLNNQYIYICQIVAVINEMLIEFYFLKHFSVGAEWLPLFIHTLTNPYLNGW